MFLPWTDLKCEDCDPGNLPDIVSEALDGQILIEQWNKQREEVGSLEFKINDIYCKNVLDLCIVTNFTLYKKYISKWDY